MNLPNQSNSMQIAADFISQADAILIGAGAGMGVDSGLPDFRGDEGFWQSYPPFKERGLSFIDLADPAWFHLDPHQAWGFYGHRLNLYRRTKPHSGFEMMKDWVQNHFVFTSNVDGHFQAAGYEQQRILECHGSIHRLQCSGPCSNQTWNADKIQIQVDKSTFLASDPLPLCPNCGAIARPNILMFSDPSWLSRRTSNQMARYSQWLNEQRNRSIVGIEIGAGTSVPSVRREMEIQTTGSQRTLIRINPRESQCRNGISISSKALETIERLNQLVCK